MEIPKAARKCPYCLHLQSSRAMWAPPLLVGILACLPLVATAVFVDRIFNRGEDYEEFKDQIVITASHAAFGDTKNGPTVGVVGMIKNNSSVPWKDIRFHVEFFDANGIGADVAQKEQYGFYLPPRESLAFKVSFTREFRQTSYVKHNVRVAAAKDARAKW
jgi:hypothetical protein